MGARATVAQLSIDCSRIYVNGYSEAVETRGRFELLHRKGFSGKMIIPEEGLVMPDYICLTCFHTWHQRIAEAGERQCSICKSRASYDHDDYKRIVETVQGIISSALPLRVAIIQTAVAMAPLTSIVRPGPRRVLNIWRRVLLEAGVPASELNNYFQIQ